jgi:hypothetical protein
MSDYEVRAGYLGDSESWKDEIAKTLAGMAAVPVIKNSCPCGCSAGTDPERSAGGDGDPYQLLRQLNDARHDPMTAREEARAAAAAELAWDDPLDGREASRLLSRRSFDGSNLSGCEALARLTEFRAI